MTRRRFVWWWRRPPGDLGRLRPTTILAVPTTTLREIPIRPSLPSRQAQAIESLKYGRVTKTLLQFDRPFWRRRGRPRAIGTDAPTGAMWDANEEQGGARGILTLMAGGQASEDSQKLVAQKGMNGLVHSLEWFGAATAQLLHSRMVIWEEDPWVRGGYAYFNSGARYGSAIRADPICRRTY